MRTFFCLLLAAVSVGPAAAQLPVSGRPVPSLSAFDGAMQDFMDEHGLEAGVLGVMADDRIVYLRAFGDTYEDANLPENALWRLASCSKPFTAAAVRRLIASGAFALTDHAFDLGQAGGGLLDLDPFPLLGDTRLQDVTVEHLLRHRGGWDRDQTDDVTYREREIADDMGVASPPGRISTVRWILGQPLDFTPDSRSEYSNVGMLTLGLIVEQESGLALADYVRQNLLTPAMWVPATEFLRGRTFRDDQSPREPHYNAGSAASVFDSRPGIVEESYGGWDHEARIGQGGYVASAAVVLEFLNRYHVGMFAADIGQPVSTAFPRSTGSHNGSLGGLSTYMRQQADGVNLFVAFNERDDPHLATAFYDNHLAGLIATVGSWPSTTSDGFWVEVTAAAPFGVGGYHAPFFGIDHALDQTTDGSKLRLRPGASSWTGVLAERLLLDAPLGAASLGN